MTFELAAVIVLGLAAVGLGLVCYHLLGRLEMLERSVQGGLDAPSTRLSREQFERRFRTAHARSSVAATIDTGVLLVIGPEHHGSELAATVASLARDDLITVTPVDELDAGALGIGTTPFLFVIDNTQVRSATAVASSADVIHALETFA